MIPLPSPVGAILAGGAARRLGGCDKAGILVHGKTLAEHAWALLSPHCAEVIALTGTRTDFALPGIEACPDRFPGQGPLAGLHAAQQARPGREILLLAVDLALLPNDVIKAILHQASLNPRAAALVPRVEGELQPVCALYRPELANEVEARLRRGLPLVMRNLAELGHAFTLDLPATAFAGVNRPEDLSSFAE